MASLQVHAMSGRANEAITLPKEIFGGETNPALLAQAIHVYRARQKAYRGHSLTRGEVALTTAKWYRQKGTGRARHGAKSAPLFVGGGVAHGPRGVRRNLRLPKKIARAALISALSARARERLLYVISPSASDNKTKKVARFFEKLGIEGRFLVLFGKEENFARCARNIEGASLLRADMANAWEVLRHPKLIITKGGLDLLTTRGGK